MPRRVDILPWSLLRVDMTRIGHGRKMRITHLPSALFEEGEGESVSWRGLQKALLPKLAKRVAVWLEAVPPVEPDASPRRG